MKIRVRNSGDVLEEQAFREMHPNISFPNTIDQATAAAFDADLVVSTPPPVFGEFQTLSVAIVQDVDSLWKEVWTISNMADQDIKSILKQRVTQKRWDVETGGIVLSNATRVRTGIDDQNRISSVLLNAQRAGITTIDFKTTEGWVQMTISDLESIANAIALHVQNGFSAEKAHYDAIDAIVPTQDKTVYDQLSVYDINTNWPVAA